MRDRHERAGRDRHGLSAKASGRARATRRSILTPLVLASLALVLALVPLLAWTLRDDALPAARAVGAPGDVVSTTSGTAAPDGRGDRAARQGVPAGPTGEAISIDVPAPPPPDVAAVATGRVEDVFGRPLAGAHVYLLPDDESRQLLGLPEDGASVIEGDLRWVEQVAALSSLPNTATDDEGRFELSALLPHPSIRASVPTPFHANGDGERSLHLDLIVTHPGYVPARQDCVEWAKWPDGRHDAGVCQLQTGGTLSGRVVDELGQPVAGALVALGDEADVDTWKCAADDQSFSMTGCGGFFGVSDVEYEYRQTAHLPFATRTDAEGRYRLGTVPGEQSHTVRAWAPGHLPVSTWVKRVVADEPRAVDDLVLSTGGRLAGRVTDAHGQSIEGARVHLGVADLPVPLTIHGRLTGLGEGWVDDEREASAVAAEAWRFLTDTTDIDGRWSIPGLTRGVHDVYVQADGHEPSWLPRQSTGNPEVEIVLRARHTLRLRVLDDTGAELALESLSVRPVGALGDDQLARGWTPRRPSDSGQPTGEGTYDERSGEWLVPDVCSCPQRLRLLGETVGNSVLELAGWSPGDDTDVREVRVDRRANVRMRLIDRKGQPIEQSWVSLRVDASGDYAAVTQEPDGVRLLSTRPGQGNLIAQSSGFLRVERPLDLAPGESLDLGDVVLPRLGKLEVRLVDATGAPAAQRLVQLYRLKESGLSGGRASGDKTDADGVVQLSTKTAGPHEVRVLAEDNRLVLLRHVLPLRTDEQQSLDLVLAGTATLRTHAEGAWKGKANVSLVLEGDDQVRKRSLRAGPPLTWTLPAPARGVALVVLEKTGLGQQVPFELQVGQQLDLGLPVGGAAVSGRVLDAVSGQPLAKAAVRLKHAALEVMTTGITDADGHFRFDRVQPGSYRLDTRVEAYLQEDLLVEVGPGGRANLELEVEPRGRVAGQILTPGGDPDLAWNHIYLFQDRPDGQPAYVVRDQLQQGRFNLHARGAGPYTLLLSEEAGYGSQARSWSTLSQRALGRWDVTLAPGQDLSLELRQPANEP